MDGLGGIRDNIIQKFEGVKSSAKNRFEGFKAKLPSKDDVKGKLKTAEDGTGKIAKGFGKGAIKYTKETDGGLLLGLSMISKEEKGGNTFSKKGMELLTGESVGEGKGEETVLKGKVLLGKFIEDLGRGIKETGNPSDKHV